MYGTINCDGEQWGECDGQVPQAEMCDDMDNNCNGQIDEGWQLGEPCGSGECAGGVIVCSPDAITTVCSTDGNGSQEICGDNIDNDCDGTVDEGCAVDADGDGYPSDIDCDDTDAILNLDDVDMDGYSTCDGDCDDFDPVLNPGDYDGDGVTSCGGDCDDTDGSKYPGKLWYPDCDGDGAGSGLAIAACDPSSYFCANGAGPDGGWSEVAGTDCDDENPLRFPGNPELCDGRDNDCDGVIPASEIDADGDGFAACSGDCDDANPTVRPGADEICGDGIDNDCDLIVDEDCYEPMCGDGAIDPGEECDDGNTISGDGCSAECRMEDADGDGWSVAEGDCDDSEASVHPGAPEICNDGFNNNCDGYPDEVCPEEPESERE